MVIDITYLDKDKNKLFTEYSAACYANTGKHLVDYKDQCVYLKTKAIVYDKLKKDQIKEYVTGVWELMNVKKAFNVDELTEELINHNSFTIKVEDLCSFDAFAICNLFRYYYEYQNIINTYNLIRDSYPLKRVSRPLALILAHCPGFHGYTMGGHTLFGINKITYTLTVKTKKDISKIITEGRKSVNYKKCNQDKRFASGHLEKTFNKFVKEQEGYGYMFHQQQQDQPAFLKNLIENVNQL